MPFKRAYAQDLRRCASGLARLEERAAKKRQLALEAMCEAGLKKLEEPDFTASARAGMPPLVIVAEPEIPEPYWVPQPPVQVGKAFDPIDN